MKSRCPYYSTDSVALPATPPACAMRLPVYRCRLSETIIARLDVTAQPSACVPVGPDMETVSPATCMPGRCQSRCLSAYQTILSEHHLDASLPPPVAAPVSKAA